MSGKSSANADAQLVDFLENINSRSVYLALVDELAAYAVCKDLNGRYTFVSRSYAAKLGQTPADLIGKSDFDFYPAELRFPGDDRL